MISSQPDRRIPVTVITGFLGSGKTTLLNHILTRQHGRRIAVIENEFGEIGIDHQIVIPTDEEIFELNNGCICCRVRGDLIKTLAKLNQRRDKFDSVLIETTGMADPGPVAQTFFTDPEVKENFVLDGLVTVVDAKHVQLHFDNTREVREQIGFADVILLNKTDLVSPEELELVEQRIRKMNPLAKLHPTRQAEIDVEKVVRVGGFDLKRALQWESDFLSVPELEHHHDDDCQEESCSDPAHHHAHGESSSPGAEGTPGGESPNGRRQRHHHGHDHEHSDDVSSVGIRLEGDLDEARIMEWMGTLLRTKGQDIFRMKGILSIKGRAERYIFQGVHMLMEGRPDRPWATEPRGNVLVFIGRNLDRKELNDRFRDCLAD